VLREFGYPVLLRFAHEMNGNWYPYSGAFTGGGSDKDDDGVADGPQAFVAAWRHVHALFTAEGATELVWVYSPNAESYPDAEWNQPYAYYPGSDYVDLIAVDVYEHPQKARKPLAALLEPVFNDFGLFFEKHAGDPKYRLRPFGLGEYGTARPDPDDRRRWYNDAFFTISEDSRIAFHAVYNAQNGDQDFSLPGPIDSLMYGQGRFAFGPMQWEPKN
jgi:mannan endo-1,4-beta-mannosidase